MMTTEWLEINQGSAPILMSLPHTGTKIPDAIQSQLACSTEQALTDTDWYVHQLYDFVSSMGISTVRTAISRCVVDVNRDPSGQSLYPGQATTELCPTTRFDGQPLYSAPIDDAEVERRKKQYFEPYHAAIRGQLDRLLLDHDIVILFDAHSIRSQCPRLFDGTLPDLNLGTNSGRSCAPDLALLVEKHLSGGNFSFVHNGRFKGGWITRHYGQPSSQVHGLQLEIAQQSYMHEVQGDSPAPYSAARAAALQSELKGLFVKLVNWAQAKGSRGQPT
jgi:N-formylglutamate deformylase